MRLATKRGGGGGGGGGGGVNHLAMMKRYFLLPSDCQLLVNHKINERRHYNYAVCVSLFQCNTHVISYKTGGRSFDAITKLKVGVAAPLQVGANSHTDVSHLLPWLIANLATIPTLSLSKTLTPFWYFTPRQVRSSSPAVR